MIANIQCFHFNPVDLNSTTRAFYRHVLAILDESKLPFLVCGSYALQAYTGNGWRTKDLDIFVRPSDRDSALEILSAAGYVTERVFPHWLAKVYFGEDFIDVIFSSGNGMCEVDDTWFAHAVRGEVLGIPVNLCPPEEIIWQKAFVMERERYDGADVAHLLRAFAKGLDWTRLLGRFGPHWRVLFAHLILFGFIYPAHRSEVPRAVMRELLGRLQAEMNGHVPGDLICQGTLLSRAQYRIDVERWGYRDPRLLPRGNMTMEEIDIWTKGIQKEVPERRP